MSMDLSGIKFQNEYYTNHYLSSVFEENVSDTLKRWKEQASAAEDKTPWAKLKAAAVRYYTIRDTYTRQRGAAALKNAVDRVAADVLGAMGYGEIPAVTLRELGAGQMAPVALEVTKKNGAPLLWAFLCRNGDEESGILEESIFPAKDMTEELAKLHSEDLVSAAFFGSDEPPRWIMLIGLYQIALIDRNKWDAKRLILFQLDDIFARREDTTLQAMAVLLHKESLCPAEGISLLDTLDENSHKHASGVSKDLKYALRQSIEILGNEVVRDMRERQHVGVFGRNLAEDLTLQCLRYMYRILFMLFIEAKPELGYAPMKAEAYALGYSFDSLRDIADGIRGGEEYNAEGNYLKESLDRLFKLVYEGYPKSDLPQDRRSSLQNVFLIDPLKAHIFDPEKTALIENAHISNRKLLQIIDLMSLTRPKKGQRRGRISYSNLGVNQLGAVYEALLSYRGFFAETELYEVKRKGDTVDELDVGYFVTEGELSKYDEDERVREEDGITLRKHARGEFIYRLAGREREKSASYYTPEVLTKCLVKYALKELLEGKTADDILSLTVCEPAMGSAAFLNEAVSQLAEAYLVRKERETGKSVPSDQRVQELQKVKMFIADRNVYGIDLNPTAVELAEVSLWLNTIYQGGYVPWFRTQIVNGNSLIGARRQCYTLGDLQGKHLWFEAAPERIEPGVKRSLRRQQVYHFLLGDPGMCAYTDKVIKAMEPERLSSIKAWGKGFTKALRDDELDTLLRLSANIDTLWDAHAQMRKEIQEKCTDPLTVWGQPEDALHHPSSIRDKDRIYDDLYLSRGGSNASPYARLRAVMDYWCALWFWPIDKADELPSRMEFLWDINMLLGANVINTRGDRFNKGQMSLFDDMDLDPYVQDMVARYGKFGSVNLDELRRDFPRLAIAHEVAQQQKFFHWELEFADIFAERGGFDLFVGNPPWVKTEWNEQAVLGDKEPMLAVKSFTATQTTKERNRVLQADDARALYFGEYEGTAGTQAFLTAEQNYPLLKGVQTNLFKCFLPQAWMFGNKEGMSGFVHPDGVYDDPKGGKLRAELYPKLRLHFQFTNEYKLFEGVHHNTVFSVNIYSNKANRTFDSIGNLFGVETIEECYDHSIRGAVPGIKDDNGNWNLHGHPDRVIHVGQKELTLFAKLFDGSEEWRSARLPVLHAKQLVEVLERFVQHRTVGELGQGAYTTQVWDETNAEKKDHTIQSYVGFPESTQTVILSSAHIGRLNPYGMTTRRIYKNNSDYDRIDLTTIPDNYIIRTKYIPQCDIKEYYRRIPSSPWGKVTDSYRLISREFVSCSSERTLTCAIAPKGFAHVNTIFSLSLKNCMDMVCLGGCEAVVSIKLV